MKAASTVSPKVARMVIPTVVQMAVRRVFYLAASKDDPTVGMMVVVKEAWTAGKRAGRLVPRSAGTMASKRGSY